MAKYTYNKVCYQHDIFLLLPHKKKETKKKTYVNHSTQNIKRTINNVQQCNTLLYNNDEYNSQNFHRLQMHI